MISNNACKRLLFTPNRSRSRPHTVKGKQTQTHTHTDIDIHPCIQTYIHAYIHPDIHGKSVSLAPYRLSSNLRLRSRELAAAGVNVNPGSSVKKRITMALSNHQPFHRGFRPGTSVPVSVCLTRSVCLGLSVCSVLVCLGLFGCLGVCSPVCQIVLVGQDARTSTPAMSIM